MSVRTTAQADALYTRHGRPPIGKAIPLALQHVVAMVVGCITMPMIVASSAGVSSQDQIIMVQASLLVAGLVPKLSAILVTIPQPVLGGATITVFGSIAMTGVRMLAREGLSPRSTFIAGLSVALAVGIPQLPGVFAGCPAWIGQIFGGSEVIIVALTAILLNLILPKEKKEI